MCCSSGSGPRRCRQREEREDFSEESSLAKKAKTGTKVCMSDNPFIQSLPLFTASTFLAEESDGVISFSKRQQGGNKISIADSIV